MKYPIKNLWSVWFGGLSIVFILLISIRPAAAQSVYREGSNYQVCTTQPSLHPCYPDWQHVLISWTYSGLGFQTGYRAQVDDNSDFSSPAVDTGWVTSRSHVYQITPGVLAQSTPYYWRVAIRDDKNSESLWTQHETAFVPGSLSVYFIDFNTDITTCANSVNQASCDVSPTFNWTFAGSNSQDMYWVQVDNNSDFSSPEYTSEWMQGGALSFTPLYGSVPPLSTLYWRMALRDNNGAFGRCTQGDPWPFATLDVCYVDIGLRVNDTNGTWPIACEKPGSITSSLRIFANGPSGQTTYGVGLVNPGAANSTQIIINTPDGPKALRKYTGCQWEDYLGDLINGYTCSANATKPVCTSAINGMVWGQEYDNPWECSKDMVTVSNPSWFWDSLSRCVCP